MVTNFENRCRDCMYLVEDDDGDWFCDDCGMKCCEIADDECSANQWDPVIEPGRDMFFVIPEDRVIKELYFNPDADSGAQFVLNSWSFDRIIEDADGADCETFFMLLDCDAKQYCYDIGDDMFYEMKELYDGGFCDAEGVNEDTMDFLVFAAKFKYWEDYE